MAGKTRLFPILADVLAVRLGLPDWIPPSTHPVRSVSLKFGTVQADHISII